MDFPTFTEGESLVPRKLYPKLNAWKNAIQRAANLSVGDGLEARDGAITRPQSLPFWARLTGGSNPYSFQEVIDTPGVGYVSTTGLRSGTSNAVEVNGLTDLCSGGATPIALLVPTGVNYRFAFLRTGPEDCPAGSNILCGSAWSLVDYCAMVNSTEGLDCVPGTDDTIPGAIEGAEVTIYRQWTDPATHAIHEEVYDSGTTDQTGRYCVEVPPTLPDPTGTPSVVVDGGGASGGTLAVGTWVAKVTHLNHYGETRPSPPSMAFQVGIPDPTQYPAVGVSYNAGLAATGGALQAGTYWAKVVYRDAAGRHNGSTTATASIPVIGLGDIKYLNVSDLSLRPNATAYDLYLSNTTAGGTYRLYKANQSAVLAALDVAFSATATTIPSGNTSLRNIPRVTFTPAGDSSRVYAVPADGGSDCKFVTATASPKDLVGVLGAGCPPSDNSTGWGTFRIAVHPEDCNSQSTPVVVVAGNCRVYSASFGFCCAAHDLTTNASDVRCYNNDCCTDENGDYGGGPSGIESGRIDGGEWWGRCAAGEPCPENTTVEYLFCGGLIGSLNNPQPTRCQLSGEGYWDREVCIEAPCGVPGVRTAASADIYSRENYVRIRGCCPVDCYDHGRPSDVIPKSLLVEYQGPEGLTGSTGPVNFTVTLNEGRSTGPNWVWDTGCLPGQGGWGLCSAPIGYACKGYAPNPYDPCITLGIIAGDYTGKVLFKSTRVSVIQGKGSDGVSPYPGGASVVWENFWEVGCPSPDPAPYCGWDRYVGVNPSTGEPRYLPVYASPVAKLDSLANCGCPCGVVAIPYSPPSGPPTGPTEPVGSALMYYPTKSGSVPVSPLCGPVDSSGVISSSGDSGNPTYVNCAGPVVISWSARVWEGA